MKTKKTILKKALGKGGPIPTSYGQASAPIDLLKVSSIPPTVPAIPKSISNSSAEK